MSHILSIEIKQEDAIGLKKEIENALNTEVVIKKSSTAKSKYDHSLKAEPITLAVLSIFFAKVMPTFITAIRDILIEYLHRQGIIVIEKPDGTRVTLYSPITNLSEMKRLENAISEQIIQEK